jgi:death-on-curing protein
MIYLDVAEVIDLHARALAQSGGLAGLRDMNGLDSAVAQPQMSFGGQELYPTVGEKAAALGFSLIMNHPFVDGNKRAGHAAMETFLVLNGYELDAGVDEQEAVILSVAAGEMTREAFTKWVTEHLKLVGP